MELIKRYRITSEGGGVGPISIYVDIETLYKIYTVQFNSLPTTDCFDTYGTFFEFNGHVNSSIAEDYLLGMGEQWTRQIAIRRPTPDAKQTTVDEWNKSYWRVEDPTVSVDGLLKDLTEYRKHINEQIQRTLSTAQSQQVQSSGCDPVT